MSQHTIDKKKIREAVRLLLEAIGEDPDRNGLQETPDRVARMYEEIFGHGDEEPRVSLSKRFDEQHHEVVLVKDIPFFSMCEHHLMPFFGKAHVAYIPNGHIIGLSKIPRVVDVFARRLQVQERLTDQVADAIMKVLRPQGVGVVIEAFHLCMMMRGVEKQNSKTVTSAVRGLFREDFKTRDEFLRLVHSGQHGIG